jgi:hypothetical protein
MSGRPAEELTSGYEALRAAATGSRPCDTPRGLSLVMAEGVPAWMRAWRPLPPPSWPVGAAGPRPVAAGLGAEVVRVITEMALGGRTGLALS